MEKSLQEQYGNNEPYTEPDSVDYGRANQPHGFFQLITGPSTNFYVGPNRIHYTIPKRLMYQYSNFAKACLEGKFAEAAANAVWLPDVDPDLFQWIWKWLYQGHLNIERYCYNLAEDEEEPLYYSASNERIQQACQLLCRVHMLGERLLMDERFLWAVQEELKQLVKRVKEHGFLNPFTPELILEVLSHSTPVPDLSSYSDTALRALVFEQLCDYDFCASFDFTKCSACFGLEGAFAAGLMSYMANQIRWAVELWGAQTESTVDVVEKKLKLAEDEGNSQSMVKRPKRRSDLWLILRYVCTFQGCTEALFFKYDKCFELDGAFAAEILAYMAGELRWIREKWGEERGPKVNVAQEKENEEWNDRSYNDIERICQRR